jgi:membrane protein DedA with SNARE-associated domain
MLEQLTLWYSNTLEQWGFFAVALLMAAESTIVPIPSEVIIPPAAYQAWNGKGLNFFGTYYTGMTAQAMLVVAGALGSWVGASIMYWVSLFAGRPLLIKYGKYFLISEAKIHGAERWAEAYGPLGIFASRLLPVVRHLIGIPAGIVKMNYWVYSIYTIVGSAIWTAVLCWLGIQVGGIISKGDMHLVTFWILGFLFVLSSLYYLFVHRHMKKTALQPTVNHTSDN